MKQFLKNNLITIESILIFIGIIIMLGFSSHGIREFFINILEIGIISFVLSFILISFIGSNEEKDSHKIPIIFFWSAMALALTIGHF